MRPEDMMIAMKNMLKPGQTWLEAALQFPLPL